MGVITPDRFNPIKAFCNVRLQQGVPLVDADVNELDDIRKFEVRAFLKWFVGNGIPDGNDGFRIAAAATPAADDLLITAGAQLAAAGTSPDPTVASPLLNEFAVHACGRCIVDGLDVIINKDVTYKNQPLYRGQAGAAALAAAYGVPVIDDIPVSAGPVIAYLDLWERTVAPSEDPSLVVPPLGTESCARLKREWVVRTAAGLALPASQVSHHLYILAVINRRVVAGVAQAIVSTDITDRREQRLLMPPSTLVPDVLGVSAADYRQGINRPVISLRDALNALLRGEMPATAEVAVTTDANNDFASFAYVFDQAGGVNAVWTSNRNLSVNQLFTARWALANPGTTFGAQTLITNPASAHQAPSAAALPNGDMIVAYSTSTLPPSNVLFKHAASLGSMTPTTPAELPVVSSAAVAQRAPFVVATGSASGGTVVFFFHENTSPTRWVYQRRAYTAAWDEATATWTDAAALPLSSSPAMASPATSPPTSSGDFHAASDGLGNVFAAFRTGTAPTASSIQVAQLTVATNALATPTALHVGASTTDLAPFVLPDPTSNSVWVFWQSDAGIYVQQYLSSTMAPVGAVTLVPDTSLGTQHANPCAVRDASGAIWLFWESDRGGTGSRIWFNRRGAVTGWSVARQVTGSAFPDSQPFAMIGPNGNVWLFWRRVVSGTNGDLYFKQIVTAI